jgi:DNA-binding transcriptional ArsR family regulator
MQAFAALADPTRRHIVELLARRGQLPVAQISKRFPVSAPAISQHLKVLREARLVRVEAHAQQRLYSLDPAGVAEMDRWMAKLHRHWTERFDALDELLAQEMRKMGSTRKKEHGK